MSSRERINLGDVVRDIYTGFEGVATGRTEWLHSCDRIGIEPTKLDKDGQPGKTAWFDEQRVELVKRQEVKTVKGGETDKPGGPQDDPSLPGGY